MKQDCQGQQNSNENYSELFSVKKHFTMQDKIYHLFVVLDINFFLLMLFVQIVGS